MKIINSEIKISDEQKQMYEKLITNTDGTYSDIIKKELITNMLNEVLKHIDIKSTKYNKTVETLSAKCVLIDINEFSNIIDFIRNTLTSDQYTKFYKQFLYNL